MRVPKLATEIIDFIKTQTKKMNQMQFALESNIQHLINLFQDLKDIDNNVDKSNKLENEFGSLIKGNLSDFQSKISSAVGFWNSLEKITGTYQFDDVFKNLSNRIAKNKDCFVNIGRKYIKRPSKPKGAIEPAKSISTQDWSKIATEISQNENIDNVLTKIQVYVSKLNAAILSQRINDLRNHINDITEEEIKNFRKRWLEEKLSVEQYISHLRNEREKQSPSKRIRRPSLQKKKLREERKQQLQNFDEYQAYLEADERTLNRMKRSGKYHLKKKKMKRRITKEKDQNGDDENE